MLKQNHKGCKPQSSIYFTTFFHQQRWSNYEQRKTNYRFIGKLLANQPANHLAFQQTHSAGQSHKIWGVWGGTGVSQKIPQNIPTANMQFMMAKMDTSLGLNEPNNVFLQPIPDHYQIPVDPWVHYPSQEYPSLACSEFPKNAKNACAESLNTLCGLYDPKKSFARIFSES